VERALSAELLGLALGDHESLPSPSDLARLISEAEIGLLLQSPLKSDELLRIAWYLHGIASTLPALELYGVDRQRAAFRVSAHIFDVRLQQGKLEFPQILEYSFAAQIAFVRSEFSPNATAIYGRELAGRLPDLELPRDLLLASLALASSLLATEADYLFPVTLSLRDQLRDLQSAFEAETIFETPLGAVGGVAQATRDLLVFLVYGTAERLDLARERLIQAITSESSREDLLSRWVAAHLLQIADGLEKSSIWTALPPDVPPGVRRAFAFARPKVVTLWPPQLEIAAGAPEEGASYFDVPRLLISMPTSAGKSLMAQLFVAAHLGQRKGGVCYVAPTRSLCNEVRQSLDSRLRYIDFSVRPDVPEFADLDLDSLSAPDVEVMTPERLAFLLRSDSTAILDRFSLFIFDEAHTVADESRGWLLEGLIAYLHTATINGPHRMVLMSAALGNRSHFVQWLSSGDQEVRASHSDWRGPRRMHCIWTTDPDWRQETVEPKKSTQYPFRYRYPLHGVLHARTTRDASPYLLRTREPIGELVLHGSGVGNRKKEPGRGTPFYRMLVPLVELLAETGPVLVIESTRPATLRMAREIAESRKRSRTPQIRGLLELATARLGDQHPLVSSLERGVAYHHGSLPLDIRSAIEDAVREGQIEIVVATTSLAEGINLPVRSVLVASQGPPGAAEEAAYITGSKLVNAIGRAGRATKETEGVVVLARQAAFSQTDFDRLDPPPNELEAVSNLATAEALATLADFEEAVRVSEDLIFEATDYPLKDFISYVWFIAAELELLRDSVSEGDIIEFLANTLAYQQLPDEARQRLERLAEASFRAYMRTDPARRARWGRAGTSIPTARTLETVVEGILERGWTESDIESPIQVVNFLLGDGRLEALLATDEAPRRSIYTSRAGAARRRIDVPINELLIDWMRGVEVEQLATNYLSAVGDAEYRLEQLGDLISSLFENYLPWTLSLTISWANGRREDHELPELPSDIPAYIRWGVDRVECLRLMARGLWSRRLAHSIANSYADSGVEDDVFTWLDSMDLREWRSLLTATPTELANLLDIVGRRRGIASRVLAGTAGEVPIHPEGVEPTTGPVRVLTIGQDVPAELGVFKADELVARIPHQAYSEVMSLLDTGLSLVWEMESSEEGVILRVTLSGPEEEP
jgi:hypothetical protein